MSKRIFHISQKIVGVLALMLISFACMLEEQEPAPSIEQIQEKEGLPVEVSTVEKAGFTKSISYYAPLTGYKETQEHSKVFDEITKINFRVGDYVNEGDVIIEFPNDNATLQYDQAKANLENMQTNWKRMNNLLKEGEISQQQFDEIDMALKVAKRNVEQLDQLLKVVAPISGTIIYLPYRVGDVPSGDIPLFKISQMNKMIAKINVSGSEYPQIKKGMKATASWNNQEYSGIVSDIALAMDQKTRSFPVEVTFDNPNKVLKSGITANINLELFDKSETIIIDRKLVQNDGTTDYVYVAANGIAVKKPITTGETSGVEIEVTSGLSEGDTLIICCSSLLKDGISLNIVNN